MDKQAPFANPCFIFVTFNPKFPDELVQINADCRVSISKNMKIKSFLAKPFASYIYKGIRKGMTTAVADQENILKTLIKTGQKTEFGKECRFG